MAIIKPSRNFAGSDLNTKNSSKYIKDGVRQVMFNKKDNPDGAWLYFLPPYTVDAEGNGVWYKVFTIRDNFGDRFKEKFACGEKMDAVDFFEKNYKIHFPDLAKVVDEEDKTTGQTRKRYPFYGRKTRRVLYNVAYVNDLEAGAHVLDLPLYNGASILNDWLKGTDARGRERPMFNDPEHCIPVFVKLKEASGGTPWLINVEQSDAAVLPEALADADNLYNLDTEVLEYRDDATLIDKLRQMFPPDVFELCMQGWPGISNATETSAPPARSAIKVASIPRASTPSAPKVAGALPNLKPTSFDEDEIPMETLEDDADETPPPSRTATAAAAAAFLRTPRKK